MNFSAHCAADNAHATTKSLPVCEMAMHADEGRQSLLSLQPAATQAGNPEGLHKIDVLLCMQSHLAYR